MPPKKALKTAAKPAPRMPKKLPSSYTNAPLRARRGWSGGALPFNDIDGALAWGFGNEKLEEAQDTGLTWQASAAQNAGRARSAEIELLKFPKHGPGGKYVPRAEQQKPAGAAVPGAPVIIARAASGGVRGRAQRAQSVPANARDPPARDASPEAAAPAKEPPPAPKKEPPPAPKKEPAPEPSRPSFVKRGETVAAALSRKAAEEAEAASMKEEQFREEKMEVDKQLVIFRLRKVRIPDELKKKDKAYSDKLQLLTNARIAAEKIAAEALLANQGVTQRKAAKGAKGKR
jgi:hypothetical protein